MKELGAGRGLVAFGAQTPARQTDKRGHMEGHAYADVPALMRKLAAASPTTGRDALRFTIYNAVRSNETRLASMDRVRPGKCGMDHSRRTDEGWRNPRPCRFRCGCGTAAQTARPGEPVKLS